MNTGGADILRLYHYTFNGTVYHTRVLLRFDLSSVASCSSAILHFTQLGEGAYEY
jgi:hypothetical protein